MESVNKIICGDCLKVLPNLPKVDMIFADPPDNLGLKYDGYRDKISHNDYLSDMASWIALATSKANIVWFSVYHCWLPHIIYLLYSGKIALTPEWVVKLFIWRFTFGQHNNNDCGNGYRPIIRLTRKDAILYPDAIREPSKRQTLYHDKRANPAGRVPDDVWEFSRVCGTFKERRVWHPNQHPEALIERIIKLSTKEGDTVTDMFAGTGTVNRVCKKLNRNCTGIEQSKFYCEQIVKEQNCLFEVA